MSKLKFKSKILSRAHILNQYAKYTTKMSAGLFFLFFKDIFIRYKVDRSFSFSTSKMLLHCFLAPLFKIMRVHTVVPCMWCVISFWLLSSLSLQFGFHQFGYDVPRHNPPPPSKDRANPGSCIFHEHFPLLLLPLHLTFWRYEGFLCPLTYSSSAFLILSHPILHIFTFSPKITLREEEKKHFPRLKNTPTLLSGMWPTKSV